MVSSSFPLSIVLQNPARHLSGLWPAVFILFVVHHSFADEGMWTFDNPPNHLLQEQYDFEITPEWSRKAMLASVRLNDGGSGAFVSNHGLVVTNHHVAMGQLQKLSTPERDLMARGFFAQSQDEELPCPDLEINQLRSYENVTDQVIAAGQIGKTEAERNDNRKAEMARLEKEESEVTGLRCDVVTLYNGGEYWIYRYKKYTDVRLVMAPEFSAGFFGGKYDNFTYPRYALDYTFLRVYEDGKPVTPDSFFRWSKNGAEEGELTFVTGHPGSTSRQNTLAQIEFTRQQGYPFTLDLIERRIKVLTQYMTRGDEETRRAQGTLMGIENYQKFLTGALGGLNNANVMAKKAASEHAFRKAVSKDAELHRKYGAAWKDLEKTTAQLREKHPRSGIITNRGYRPRTLVGRAETIVLLSGEMEKPNGDRYREFRDSNLESLKLGLFSTAPIYADLEEVLLAETLREYTRILGTDDPFVNDLLQGQDPDQLAKQLIADTKLADPDVRKQLVEGGNQAIHASDDPLIEFALRLEPHYREERDWYEDRIESVEIAAKEKIANAQFELYGKTRSPDATFTLRMSYGVPKRYVVGTTQVPYRTVFGGLYARADSFDQEEPFNLSPKVEAARGRVDQSVAVNFVSTHDITGGNSGSPVINRNLEYVGIIFDGNIQSLSNDYVYSTEVARAVSVHSEAIIHSLEKIYGMNHLVAELRNH